MMMANIMAPVHGQVFNQPVFRSIIGNVSNIIALFYDLNIKYTAPSIHSPAHI